MQRLRERGISIIYISHRMDEIFRITDRITVLRDGRRVLTDDTAALTMNQVIDAIVGKTMEQAFEWQERSVDRSVAPLLQVRNLSAGKRVQDVSFDLYPGEILGLAGLMGSGRTELARAIFGIDRVDKGQILIRGEPTDIRNPEDAITAGVSLVPRIAAFRDWSSTTPSRTTCSYRSWIGWTTPGSSTTVAAIGWPDRSSRICASRQARSAPPCVSSPAVISRKWSSANGWLPSPTS